MKYFVRAAKYFVMVSIILAVILGILMLIGAISTDINVIFKDGWKSVGWIALMFAAVSLIYPRFGYATRPLAVPGSYAELRPGILEFMQQRGYELEKEEGENLSFRARSLTARIARSFEDRISFTRDLGGFEIEGLNRDVVRILYGLEHKLKNPSEES